MKKLSLITMVLILLCANVFAEEVKLEDAQSLAGSFINQRSVDYENDFVLESVYTIEEDGNLFYVFNFSPSAFVMVSAIDVIRPIPAYSLSSQFDIDRIPTQFSSLLKHYKDQAKLARLNKVVATEEIELEWAELRNGKGTMDMYLEPLLTSTWDQSGYYNDLCPDGDIGQALTGCVATACTQLMYYFRYPLTGEGSYSYTCENYGEVSADFGSAFYNFDEMTNSAYRPNYEMAEIVHHFGVTVDMDYGPDGSGMWNHSAANSLKTYFKFDPETEYLFRDETSINWDSLIYDHLDRRIPMYYAGWHLTDTSSGHAFIVDGYQDEYFHFNWGWGGSQDGYFLTDDLYPGGMCFNYHQELIINAIPDTNNYIYYQECAVDSVLTFMDGSITDGSGVFRNYDNDMFCSWLIDPQNETDSISYIEINVHRLNLGEGDIVTLYDGEDDNAEILQVLSGSDLPDMIVSSSNKVYITFESNATNTDEGWMLTYKAIMPDWCDGMTYLNDDTGVVSDGSGDFYYYNNNTCFWRIQTTQYPDGLAIAFTDFSLADEWDKISIFDYTSGNLVDQYVGGDDPYISIVPSCDAYVVFETDGQGRGEGWTFEYGPAGSVNDVLKSKLKVYPNPATASMTVDFNGVNIDRAEVRTLTGKLVYQSVSDNSSVNDQMNLDVSEWAKGIYILNISSEGNLITEKLIIQ